jgi:hypothetical protein
MAIASGKRRSRAAGSTPTSCRGAEDYPPRHCEPTDRANARPMTGSAKHPCRSTLGLLRRLRLLAQTLGVCRRQ